MVCCCVDKYIGTVLIDDHNSLNHLVQGRYYTDDYNYFNCGYGQIPVPISDNVHFGCLSFKNSSNSLKLVKIYPPIDSTLIRDSSYVDYYPRYEQDFDVGGSFGYSPQIDFEIDNYTKICKAKFRYSKSAYYIERIGTTCVNDKGVTLYGVASVLISSLYNDELLKTFFEDCLSVTFPDVSFEFDYEYFYA